MLLDSYKLETEYFECQCMSVNHTVRFVYDPKHLELYMDVFLERNYPWWKRIVIALRYIFNYNDSRDIWADVIFKPEDADRMINLFSKLKPNN